LAQLEFILIKINSWSVIENLDWLASLAILRSNQRLGELNIRPALNIGDANIFAIGSGDARNLSKGF
jgi:hypothetical protein